MTKGYRSEEVTSIALSIFSPWGNALRKNEILVAVAPESLAQIINHLFDSQPDYHVVKHLQERAALVEEASRLQPDLIIANLKLLGSEAATIISNLKLSSPGSKIIIINFSHDLGRHARKWGADAYLDEEYLVRQLLPKVQKLLSRERSPLKADHKQKALAGGRAALTEHRGKARRSEIGTGKVLLRNRKRCAV